MMYTGDPGRFLCHVFGTGRVFIFSGDGGDMRLSAAFADFARLRPVFEKKEVREWTEYSDSAMIRCLHTTFVTSKGTRVSSVDKLTFCGNPVTGVMIATAATVSGLILDILPFPGVKIVPHTELKDGNDRQYLRLMLGKRSVYIVPDINVSIVKDGKRLLIEGGTARFLIIEPGSSSGGTAKVKRLAGAPTRDEEAPFPLAKEAKNVFSARTEVYLDQADFGKGLFSALAMSCFRVIRNMRTRTGGVRCTESTCSCDALAMGDFLHFASVFNLRPIADGIADTFYRIMRENGRFPQFFSPDGTNCFMPYNAASVSGLAAVGALFRYEEHFRMPHTRLRRLAESVLEEQLPLIKSASLPFSGTERGFITGEISGDERFQGSALNTLLFLRIASIYLSLPGGPASKLAPELRTASEHIKNNFQRNFCYGDMVFANSPRRFMNLRLPHNVTGFCRICAEYVMLVHTARGYVCPYCGNDCGGAGYFEPKRPLYAAPFFIARYAPGIFACGLPTRSDYDGMDLRELAAGIAFFRFDYRRQTEVIEAIAERFVSDPDSFTPYIMCRIVADMKLYRTFARQDYSGAEKETEDDETDECK